MSTFIYNHTVHLADFIALGLSTKRVMFIALV